MFRIALANVEFPASPEASVTTAGEAIARASAEGAGIVCFPECFVPGYRSADRRVPPPDAAFLDRAWSAVASAAAKGKIAVVLGTERVVDDRLVISALVVDRDGTRARVPGQGADRSVGGGHLLAGLGQARVHDRAAHLRRVDLPRRVAVSRDGAMAGAAGRAGRLPSAFPRSGVRAATGRRRLRIPRTRSTRRPRCAARRRTPASSPR